VHERDLIVRSCCYLKQRVKVLRQIPPSIESIIILNPPIDKAKAVGELIDHFVGGRVFHALTTTGAPAKIGQDLEPDFYNCDVRCGATCVLYHDPSSLGVLFLNIKCLPHSTRE
jgi:hypothetical protein